MKVLIVDDSEVLWDALRSMLSGLSDLSIVGYEKDESGAIDRVKTLLPDAVILDINLQSGSGITVLKHIKKYHPWIKVMILTNYASDYIAKSCKHFQADRFLDKSFQFMEVRNVLLNWKCQYNTIPEGLRNAGQ